MFRCLPFVSFMVATLRRSRDACPAPLRTFGVYRALSSLRHTPLSLLFRHPSRRRPPRIRARVVACSPLLAILGDVVLPACPPPAHTSWFPSFPVSPSSSFFHFSPVFLFPHCPPPHLFPPPGGVLVRPRFGTRHSLVSCAACSLCDDGHSTVLLVSPLSGVFGLPPCWSALLLYGCVSVLTLRVAPPAVCVVCCAWLAPLLWSSVSRWMSKE